MNTHYEGETIGVLMMAFRIKPNESVAKCVRRLSRAQIDKALLGLTGRSGAGPEEVVHDVRKRLKRVRALIRLARDGLGRKRAEREGARFRDAGRPLSEVRDAAVLVGTLDGLIDRFGDQGRAESIGTARDALLRRKRDVCRRVPDEEHAPARIAETLEEARRDVKKWRVSGGGWSAIEGGLERIYKRGYRAFHEAKESPTDEGLHQWRKRVKDLRHLMEILKPIRPAFAESRGEAAQKLADLLGDDHDLAVLRQTLSTSEDETLNRASAEVILPLIDHRKAELRRDAFALGPTLFGERPDVFLARLRAYWREWRAKPKAAEFEDAGRALAR
jgi:CHAD domain-containing protein